MIGRIFPFIKPILHRFGAETAHAMTINGLALLPAKRPPTDDPRLRVKAFGLDFPNPVGLAAGFDKNADVPDQMLGLGFGFVEIGTVTPLPQPGNARPRIFRLAADRGVINRLGFNSGGHETALPRLRRRAGRPGILGINIGANKDAVDRIADYVAGIRAFAPHVGYFAVNVSSPNTPGLRDLQARDVLRDLLMRVVEARDAAAAPRRPVLLKIAPDLSLHGLDDVVDVARATGIEGMIVSNTTLSRPASLQDRVAAAQTGGLSGQPLFTLSTRMLAETFLRAEGAFPLIGVGGIGSAESAMAKIRAGASLIQLYSAMIYEGPDLVVRIKAGLLGLMRDADAASIETMVGLDAKALSAAPF